jgi:hypothetical protein
VPPSRKEEEEEKKKTEEWIERESTSTVDVRPISFAIAPSFFLSFLLSFSPSDASHSPPRLGVSIDKEAVAAAAQAPVCRILDGHLLLYTIYLPLLLLLPVADDRQR